MRNYKLALLHLPFLIALIWLALVTDGTGGTGDTLLHFYYAQASWQEPIYLFNLWAKPFFTLFASPFAQFGFNGIQVFNAICGTSAVFLASLSAKNLGKGFYYLLPLLAFIAPGFHSYLFSGLTEPFAALVLIAVVYLLLKNQKAWAYLLASFLPYCRSEAQVLLLVLLLYGIIQKHYRYLPLLLAGTILYALIGRIWHDSLFWINEEVYRAGASVYGKGNWTHYAERLWVMLQPTGGVLLAIGLLWGLYHAFSSKLFRQSEMWLTYGLFFTLFAAHTTVWALGIYASAGMERTLILVFPLMWIIMLDGLNILLKALPKFNFQIAVAMVFIAFYTYQTFYRNGLTNYYHNYNITLSQQQKLMRDSVQLFIQQNGYKKVISDDSFLPMADGENLLLSKRYLNWKQWTPGTMQNEKAVFIWENKVAPLHSGVQENTLDEFGLSIRKKWEVPNIDTYYLALEIIPAKPQTPRPEPK